MRRLGGYSREPVPVCQRLRCSACYKANSWAATHGCTLRHHEYSLGNYFRWLHDHWTYNGDNCYFCCCQHWQSNNNPAASDNTDYRDTGDKQVTNPSYASITKPKVNNAPPLQSFELTNTKIVHAEDHSFLQLGQEDVEKVIQNMELAIVMKFTNIRRTLEASLHNIERWGLSTQPAVGVLDNRHVLVRMFTKEDLHIAWLHDFQTIEKVQFRIMKWQHDMTSRYESPIVVWWVRLPGLIPAFCTQPILQMIGDTFAKFVDADPETLNTTKPAHPRIRGNRCFQTTS